MRRQGGLHLAWLVGLLAFAPKALAAEFTVNTPADIPGGECATTCTLRDAVTAALSSPDSSNTINVPAGTYVLSPAEEAHSATTGELRITNAPGTTLTIKGAGVGATVINAAGHDRVMSINGGGVDILEGMTIEGGFQHEDEPKSFNEDDVRGAGILQQGGELTVQHVELAHNKNNGFGGGIASENDATLTVLESELDRDAAGNGGGSGIYMQTGTLAVSDTTFDYDSGEASDGGGVYLKDATSTFTNVTFAEDGFYESNLTYEGGAAYITRGRTSFTNVTFFGDIAGGGFGGGSDLNVEETAEVNLKNVLLGPTADGGADDPCTGEDRGAMPGWNDLGGNLAAGETCFVAASESNQSLGVGMLGANGGPTLTVPLLEGSPAIDFGIAGCPTTDQRGYGRVGNCDSGAFEFGGIAPVIAEPISGKVTGGSSGNQTPNSTTATTTSTSSAGIATTPQAVEELLLGCGKRTLVLNDVLVSHGHVLLNGSAAKSLAGKKVKIIFDGKKQVASALVGSNGEFSTTAPLPPSRLRNSNSARYMAVSEGQRSLNLKLTRRLILQPPTFSGGSVTLTGQVTRPLTKPASTVTVEQQLQCGNSTKVLTFTPPANGRFHVTITGIPAGAKAGIYRLSSSVLDNPKSHNAFGTFSLPLPVALG